jgi:hypothetical protein
MAEGSLLETAHLEGVALPGSHIQIEPSRLQVLSIAFVPGIAEQILQPA